MLCTCKSWEGESSAGADSKPVPYGEEQACENVCFIPRCGVLNSSELGFLITALCGRKGPTRRLLGFLSSEVILENSFIFAHSLLDSSCQGSFG